MINTAEVTQTPGKITPSVLIPQKWPGQSSTDYKPGESKEESQVVEYIWNILTPFLKILLKKHFCSFAYHYISFF